MTSVELTTRQANLIGRSGNVICRYGWDRVHARFQWTFYRNGVKVGSTSVIGEVLPKVERLVRIS